MDKLFQIGDFIFRLCCPAEVTPPENFMKFEIGSGLPGQRESGQLEESVTVKAPEYTYHIEVSDHLPEPDGKIVARRPDLLVFQCQAEGDGVWKRAKETFPARRHYLISTYFQLLHLPF